MTYQLYQKAELKRFFIEKCSRSKIPYRTVKEMKKLHVDWDFMIIGEIGNHARSFDCQDVLLTGAGAAIPIFPRGSLKKPFEWIAGYIAVGENTYVAAVRNLFPAFLQRR